MFIELSKICRKYTNICEMTDKYWQNGNYPNDKNTRFLDD